MTTAQLIQAAENVAIAISEIENKHRAEFDRKIKEAGLEDSGQCAERSALVDALYNGIERERKEIGGDVANGFAMYDGVICEATVTTKWNSTGRRYISNRFYIAKGVKRDGTIKRGRYTLEKAIAKLG